MELQSEINFRIWKEMKNLIKEKQENGDPPPIIKCMRTCEIYEWAALFLYTPISGCTCTDMFVGLELCICTPLGIQLNVYLYRFVIIYYLGQKPCLTHFYISSVEYKAYYR